MTQKIVAGDIVECIVAHMNYGSDQRVGDKFVVAYVHADGSLCFTYDTSRSFFANRFIKLDMTPNGVNNEGKPIHFGLHDLKDWMKVRLDNGKFGIVRTNNPTYGICVIYDDFSNVVSIDEISEVYDLGDSWSLFGKNNTPREDYLVWRKQVIFPAKTHQQIAIEELEASIKESQDKLTALKATL